MKLALLAFCAVLPRGAIADVGDCTVDDTAALMAALACSCEGDACEEPTLSETCKLTTPLPPLPGGSFDRGVALGLAPPQATRASPTQESRMTAPRKKNPPLLSLAHRLLRPGRAPRPTSMARTQTPALRVSLPRRSCVEAFRPGGNN
jgi:hypothetical protein